MIEQIRPSPFPGRTFQASADTLVIIDAVATETSGRWGIRIVRSDGSRLTQISNFTASKSTNDNLVDASIRSFGAAIRASEQYGPIDLDIRCRTIHAQSHAIIRRLDGVRGVIGLVDDPDATALRVALGGVVMEVPAIVIPYGKPKKIERPGAARPTTTSAIVSVDASLDREGKIAGLGWAVSNKAGDRIIGCGHGIGTVPTGSNNLAEVAAITFGLDQACQRFPAIINGIIRVQSDSLNAINIAERAISGNPLPTSSKAQHVATQELISTVTAYGLHLDFEWVKGHSGDHLNEAADRMALLARRNEEFGVSEAVAGRMTENACDEITGLAA